MIIGFIGLGSMGAAMALNLVKAGHDVRGWNRSKVAAQAVPGITLVDDPADVFQADIVFTMLSDDAAIRDVVLDGGLLTRARHGLVHVVTSTISVAFTRELATLHGAAGLGYVSAPVLGRPDVAASGQLNILAAGKVDAIDVVEPVLAALGKKVWRLGDDPARAISAKLACNMMIAMAIEAMAEGVVLAEGSGLGRSDFFELILGTLFSGRAYESYSAQITKKSFEPGFKAELALKDMRLATEALGDMGRILPMLETVRERLSDAASAGLGGRDWSIIAALVLGDEGERPER